MNFIFAFKILWILKFFLQIYMYTKIWKKCTTKIDSNEKEEYNELFIECTYHDGCRYIW